MLRGLPCPELLCLFTSQGGVVHGTTSPSLCGEPSSTEVAHDSPRELAVYATHLPCVQGYSPKVTEGMPGRPAVPLLHGWPRNEGSREAASPPGRCCHHHRTRGFVSPAGLWHRQLLRARSTWGPSEKLPENCKELPHPAEDWPQGGRTATRSETCLRPSHGAAEVARRGGWDSGHHGEGWLTGMARRP